MKTMSECRKKEKKICDATAKDMLEFIQDHVFGLYRWTKKGPKGVMIEYLKEDGSLAPDIVGETLESTIRSAMIKLRDNRH